MKSIAFGMILSLLHTLAAGQAETSAAVRQGMEKGFRTCAAEMDRVVRDVAKDDGAHLGTWNTQAPDDRMFNTLLVRTYSDGNMLVTVTAVKNALGKCDVTMTQAFSLPAKPCPTLRETILKGWKFFSDVGGLPVYEHPDNPSLNATLAPIGVTGCLVVRHVVNFSDKP